MIYSQWIDTITYFLATATTTDTIVGDLTVPKLDLNMLNTGEIKVYANLNTTADPVVVPLPYKGGDGAYIDVYFFVGGLELESNLNIDGLPIRYVLIPGGTTARTAKTVNWNDYKSVQKYLGLKD